MKNFRKTALGAMAILMAFGIVFSVSAFKAKEQKRTPYTFYYDGPIPADEDDVKDVDNWKYDDQGQQCSVGDELACTITVDENFVDDSGTPQLLPTINLQAEEHSSAPTAYITGSADNTMDISNRAFQ